MGEPLVWQQWQPHCSAGRKEGRCVACTYAYTWIGNKLTRQLETRHVLKQGSHILCSESQRPLSNMMLLQTTFRRTFQSEDTNACPSLFFYHTTGYCVFDAFSQEYLTTTENPPARKVLYSSACPALLGHSILADIRWMERSPNCRKNRVRDRAAISFQRNGTDPTN